MKISSDATSSTKKTKNGKKTPSAAATHCSTNELGPSPLSGALFAGKPPPLAVVLHYRPSTSPILHSPSFHRSGNAIVSVRFDLSMTTAARALSALFEIGLPV